MRDKHADLLKRLEIAISESQGDLDTTTRRELLAGKPIAGKLGSFAIKVAQNATTITDAHVQALIDSGCSEDSIFECVLAAATGAGLERLHAGLAVLRGKP
jgi:alkylhydroperoxidase/carboxymuconolactone decarboxylase family protein YurZ